MKLKNVELNFTSLLKPSTFGEQKAKYSTMIVFPTDHPQVDELKAEINKIKKDKWGPKALNMPKLKSCLKESPYVSNNGDTIIPEGFYYMTISTAYNEDRANNGRPVLVDAKLNPIDSSADIYSGCIAHVSFVLKAYNLETSKGVTGYVQGVQVIEKAQRKDGTITDGAQLFEKEDGFTRDTTGFEVEDTELDYGQAA